MRTLTLLTLSALLPAQAMAWDSEVDDLTFEGTVEFLRGADFSFRQNIGTVPIPVIGDTTVAIRGSGDTNATLNFSQPATSELSWPTSLTHSWKGQVNAGSAEVDAETVLGVYLDITVGSTYAVPLYQLDFDWVAEAVKFDTLLLPGRTNAVPIEMITDFYRLERTWDDVVPSLISGLGITVGGRIGPEFDSVLSGIQVVTNEVEIQSYNGTGLLELPRSHNGIMPMNAVWEGNLFVDLDLVIEPIITVHIPSGNSTIDFDLGSLLMDLWLDDYFRFDMAEEDTKIASEDLDFDHPLPAIGVRSTIDLGSAFMTDEILVDVPIQNIGDLELEGEVTFEGDAAIWIDSSDSFQINADGSGSITLGFAPDAAGDFTGTLIFASNDPVAPEVEVAVIAKGIELDRNDPNSPNYDGGDLETRGCGCNSTPATGSFGFLGLGLLGLALRRRR